MRLSSDIIMIIGGIGIAQGLFLALYSWIEGRVHKQHGLFAAMCFSTTIWIVMNVCWAYIQNIPNWCIVVGLVAHSLSAVFLLLYVQFYKQSRTWQASFYWHFAIPIGFFLLMAIGGLAVFGRIRGYDLLLIHQFIYAVASLYLIDTYRRRQALQRTDLLWLSLLAVLYIALAAVYMANHFFQWTPYLMGSKLYALSIYAVSFYALKNKTVFELANGKKRIKYQNINLSEQTLSDYSDRIIRLMEIDKSYLDQQYTLSKLAEQLSIPSYLLSHVINKKFEQNFSDFINGYRIREAQKRLTDPNSNYLKIAAIAHDCGFKSLSSFNNAFKRYAGITPSQFKRQNSTVS